MSAQREETVVIRPPNFKTAEFKIIGAAPYVQLAFSEKARGIMREKQQAGDAARIDMARQAWKGAARQDTTQRGKTRCGRHGGVRLRKACQGGVWQASHDVTRNGSPWSGQDRPSPPARFLTGPRGEFNQGSAE